MQRTSEIDRKSYKKVTRAPLKFSLHYSQVKNKLLLTICTAKLMQ